MRFNRNASVTFYHSQFPIFGGRPSSSEVADLADDLVVFRQIVYIPPDGDPIISSDSLPFYQKRTHLRKLLIPRFGFSPYDILTQYTEKSKIE